MARSKKVVELSLMSGYYRQLVGSPDVWGDDEYDDEDYPLMQDVMDARPAVLLLEVVNRLEGIGGVSKLARKWKEKQPRGYLFWLDILKKEKDQKSTIQVRKEGLKALKEGEFRKRFAVLAGHSENTDAPMKGLHRCWAHLLKFIWQWAKKARLLRYSTPTILKNIETSVPSAVR